MDASNARTISSATDSRRNTVLPKIEWKGETPHLVSAMRDRFEELRVLGTGGMGEVVLAKDHDIGRTVALKRMTPGQDIGKVMRFVEEVRAIGSLEHPNIVPLHDVGIDPDGRFFLVMKRLDGETLESLITRLRSGDKATLEKFSFPKRTQIFMQVLAAVAYAHGQGFVHRDIKPANIMLGPFGEVTVMDWGLAKRIRDASPEVQSTAANAEPRAIYTQLGSLIGTPLYMSPEQARGEHDKVDERSDIYSLTVLFHELLFLDHYLLGRQELNDVIEGVKTFSPHVSSHVPAELQWFLSRGFEKNPADRFKSVDEMIGSLQNIIDGRFDVQCARTFAKRGLLDVGKALDQNPKLVISAGVVAGLLAIAGIGKLLADVISALAA